MNNHDIVKQIETILGNMAQGKGLAMPKVDADTQLLGGALPIDSLDLATLVVELEQATGFDPFKRGFINFRTVGELAKLYQQ